MAVIACKYPLIFTNKQGYINKTLNIILSRRNHDDLKQEKHILSSYFYYGRYTNCTLHFQLRSGTINYFTFSSEKSFFYPKRCAWKSLFPHASDSSLKLLGK